MTKQNRTGANEGIQANVVKADVVAVGRGARAVKVMLSEGGRRELLEAVSKIHRELDKLDLSRQQQDEVKQHAAEIERMVTRKQADPKEAEGTLGKFVKKLQEVGVIVKETTGLLAPLRTIAGLFHLSLTSLGLG